MTAELPSIAQASREMREGALTPLDLVEHCLARIEQLEPQVKAWVSVDVAGARREAERCVARAARPEHAAHREHDEERAERQVYGQVSSHGRRRSRPFRAGRRRPRPDSPNTAWRNEAFRGYADHLADADYRAAFERLCALARGRRCALMCAESLWWRCHRSLIADDLALHGWTVSHILGNALEPHAFRVAARLVDGVPRYGDGQAGLFETPG